jgi:hypothetical protein
MMRLQIVVVQKVPEEVADRQSEASLEVGDEENSFTGLRCRHSLAGR